MSAQRRNVLFVTTRQWNPGDEIILFGCLNLLRAAGLDYNPVIFNRNPQIRHKGKRAWLWDRQPFLDNSWKNETGLDCIDLVVFAGSPEWRGKRLLPLYRALRDSRVPVIFLGLGTNRPFEFSARHFSDDERAVFGRAALITVRDTLTRDSLRALPAVHQLSCPALLSCPQPGPQTGAELAATPGPVRAVRRIGLIFGSDRAVTSNNISAETYAYLAQLYRALLQRYAGRYEFELVTHYIDELPHARADLPELPLLYSYDARDLPALYGRCDLVIGPRVHGIGVSASQGIPGICLVHDARGDTVKGFGAHCIRVGAPVEEVCAQIDAIAADPAAAHAALAALRARAAGDYLPLLREALARSGLLG